jgi:hypothetical protein
MDPISTLHQNIEQVCPIYSVSIGDKNDKSTWKIDFKPEANNGQKTAANSVLQAFDFNQTDINSKRQKSDKLNQFNSDVAKLDALTKAAFNSLLAYITDQ